MTLAARHPGKDLTSCSSLPPGELPTTQPCLQEPSGCITGRRRAISSLGLPRKATLPFRVHHADTPCHPIGTSWGHTCRPVPCETRRLSALGFPEGSCWSLLRPPLSHFVSVELPLARLPLSPRPLLQTEFSSLTNDSSPCPQWLGPSLFGREPKSLLFAGVLRSKETQHRTSRTPGTG